MTKVGLATCPTCGAQFECGAKTDRPCWCVNLPRIMPVPVDGKSGCLCPDCLEKVIETYLEDSHKRD